jgi:hypothetical protein
MGLVGRQERGPLTVHPTSSRALIRAAARTLAGKECRHRAAHTFPSVRAVSGFRAGHRRFLIPKHIQPLPRALETYCPLGRNNPRQIKHPRGQTMRAACCAYSEPRPIAAAWVRPALPIVRLAMA